ETKNHFSCSSEEVSKDKNIIKLFLSTDNLKVYCFFRSETIDLFRTVLSVFTSGGNAPELIIMNSTYHDHFYFNLSLFNNRVLWLIDIPRKNITGNKDIASVEEWIIKVTMSEGLNIYNTEGTLLDLVREPILQWNLGTIMNGPQVKKLYPHVRDIKVTKCLCANDVALLGLILNSTFNGQSAPSMEPLQLLHEVLTLLGDAAELPEGYKHKVTTRKKPHLLLRNQLELIVVSKNFRAPMILQEEAQKFYKVDYIKGKLWYNERCFANRENFEVDYVTITFDRNRTLSEASACFYSKEPFLQWLPCLSSISKSENLLPHVITFLIDQESQTGIYLFHHRMSKKTFVSVSVFKNDKPNEAQPKFPNFLFPSSFSNPVGMVFHPRSHFLYVYGNQVWLSMDGGNSFDLLCDFQINFVKKTAHSFYSSDISFITQSGRIYMTKAGLARYTMGGKCSDKIFTIYYDYLGFIHKLTPERFETGSSPSGTRTFHRIFGTPPDMGFDAALAPQFVSPNEMLFFAYVPLTEPEQSVYKKKLKNIHLGKVISHRKTGEAYIKKLLVHTNGPLGFQTSVLTDIIQPFGIDEYGNLGNYWILGSLNISYFGNNMYLIHIVSKAETSILLMFLWTPGACSSYARLWVMVAMNTGLSIPVHRFKFPVTQYPVVLEIIDEKQKVSVKPPYLVTMTEVNRRQNWQLKHNMPANVKKMKDYLDPRLKTPVYNPFGLNLSIRGSELFHFKVSVIPGVSFCDLHEEFQIYVDEVPLPFPGHILIAVATSVLLGGLIFVAFLFQLRNIHPLRAFRRYVRGTIRQSSNISIDS
ncbi:cation channel sperm-associated protein subunit beta-like isoform X1, partial [Cricetulus griseus]|uniref:cation channel sperm-associated protein subunit beta-like isoform X1 n=1 Tax=Cricetulus griseus TaxID=10029 RepID=UPI0004541D69